MRNIFLVARREYLEQVRGKAFRLTTVLIPLLFAAIFAVSALSSRNSGVGKHIVVASEDAALAGSVRDALVADKEAKMVVDVVAPARAADRQSLVARTDQKQIDGFLWLTAATGKPVQATYESRTSGDFATNSRLREAVSHATLEERLVSRGLSKDEAATLTGNVKLNTRQIKNGKESNSDALTTFFAAYIMAFLLSFTTMMYGMNVGRSVIQEKTSRIFEVMLSTVQPGEMLAGKLIGIGAVGLTQLGIWIVAASLLAGSSLAAGMMSGGLKGQVSALQLALFAIYFVLGYALYSTLFAGLAATCDTEQELQQYTPLAALPVWIGFGAISYIVSNPNSPWSVALSLFPPCAPITMFLRMASQMPPLWQILASVGLLLLSVWAVLWFSSRVYRVGILMYGKRATLPEMMRWLRYS